MTGRFTLATLALSVLLGACTDGSVIAEQLPSSEPGIEAALEYQVHPERARAASPPLLSGRLLAGHPAHARFAVSDRRRLWLGEGETLREQPRPHDANAEIEAMVMDAKGVLWLLSADNRLSSVEDSGIHEQPPLPVHATSLHAGAGHLVVLGSMVKGQTLPPKERVNENRDGGTDEDWVMAVSEDGRDWTLRRRPMDLSEDDDLAIAPDGRLTLMDGNEAGCGGGWQERWQGHLTRKGWTTLDWPHDDPSGRMAASGGWSYGYEACDDGSSNVLCAVDKKGVGTKLVEAEYGGYSLAHIEGVTMLVTPKGRYDVRSRRAKRVGEGLPELEFAPQMTISSARALVFVHNRLLMSSDAGWTELELPV